MSPIASLFQYLRVYNILIGDIGVLVLKPRETPSVAQIIACNTFTVLNILFNLYFLTLDLQHLRGFRNVEIVIMCLSMWSIPVLLLHIVFSTQFAAFVAAVQEIDEEMLKLQLPLKYHSITRKARIYVCLSLVISLIQPLSEYVHPSRESFTLLSTLAWISLNISTGSVFLAIVIRSKLITEKFRTVNAALEHRFLKSRVFVVSKRRVDILRQLAKIHQLTCDVTRTLNRTSAIQVMTFYLPCFVNIQQLGYDVYQDLYDGRLTAANFYPLLYLSAYTFLFFLAIINNFVGVRQAAKRTLTIVHRIMIVEDLEWDVAFKRQLIFLCHQLQDSKVHFSCGLFHLDWSFFTMVFLSVLLLKLAH